MGQQLRASAPPPPKRKLRPFRNNGSANGPLRTIIAVRSVGGTDCELLECGHFQSPTFSEIPLPTPRRRRCRKCKDGMIADVAPADFFVEARDGMLANGNPGE